MDALLTHFVIPQTFNVPSRHLHIVLTDQILDEIPAIKSRTEAPSSRYSQH
jgi:hypothetical protein